jgi:hypothetical protein
MAVTAAEIPLCTEITMAKGLIIMVIAEPMPHTITMTNTMPPITGTMVIQGIVNTAETTIMLLTIEIETAITIAIPLEAIIRDLLANKR